MIIIFFIIRVHSLRGYIKHQSWNQIRSLLSQPSITPIMKDCIHKKIYYYYEFLALKQTNLFYKKYWKYCTHIPKNELAIYALYGLNKAIRTYNPKYLFYTYAITYINGELFTGLTDLQPLTNLPKQYRKNTTWKNNNRNLFEIKTNPVLIQNDWQIDKLVNNKNKYIDNNIINYYDKIYKYENIWSKINKLDAFTRRIFNLKYDYEFNTIRSTKVVAELMCCSVEQIRIKFETTRTYLFYYENLISNRR
uniref:Uncharacterized protein n=1 Tax=viral metagenome TaxID=1070528 RepID=A0A6C0B9W8_9ZZZZ